jgi:hypothetical protein
MATTRRETHVIPSDGAWDVVQPGRGGKESRHETQKEAEKRARKLLWEAGGGELIIHGRDGLIRESDSVIVRNSRLTKHC